MTKFSFKPKKVKFDSNEEKMGRKVNNNAKNNVKRGQRFGKTWFPYTKSDKQ